MSYLLCRADAARIPLGDKSVDLIFGSPPYLDSRLYLEAGEDLGIARNCDEWVQWMLRVSREAIRVSRGPVLWVVSGNTRDRNYRPGPEGLIWEWYKSGGFQENPCYWKRSGIPGSGGDQWFRKDVEYVIAFKCKPKFDWSDNTACGEPPKHDPGGKMANRLVNGERVRAFSNQTRRTPNGKRDQSLPRRPIPEVSNPGNWIDTGAGGGGNIGHAIAHENEAPFPEALAEFFVKSLCPPGGSVCDPFSGSGTTLAVAERLGRIGIGFDLRASQTRLARQRLERPHLPVQRSGRVEHHPLFRDEET